ncbi:MAG TPA: type IV pilus secretin PilQ [Myxococcales bacterium]|nr:secretin [Deltaproteobacteria bacterium]MBU48176.1 secretin [Deltaproteobacteria bacterium]HAA56671.1 type IV pilus secretin PilQ [Myxococcales bacterium]|tara:strand:- start:3196 stop:5514 length:2319 start_codon:yes stop_codon:yes gene_type:complete
MKMLMRLVVIYLFCGGLFLMPLFHVDANASSTHTKNTIETLGLKVKGEYTHITLKAKKALRFSTLPLQNPPRLVLDIQQASLRGVKAPARPEEGPVRGISVQQFSSANVHIGRLVIHLHHGVTWKVKRLSSRQLRFEFKGKALRQHTKRALRKKLAPQKRFAAQWTARRVEDIGFSENNQTSTISIQLSRPDVRRRIRRRGRVLSLDLKKTTLKAAQRQLNTRDFQGAIKHIQAFQRGRDVRLVVQLRDRVKHRIKQHGTLLQWSFDLPSFAKTKIALRKQPTYNIKYHQQQVGQADNNSGGGGSGRTFTTPNTKQMLSVLARRQRKKRYRGRRISMYFRKVEIHNLLRLFSEISGLNVITSSNVKGRITLKLRNVPWDQALDLVLKTLKLGMEREGNIIRIATLTELQQEQVQRQRLLQSRLLEQPQKIRLIPVNYAQATALAAQVKTVLSPRGKVTVDNRTNVLIVKDYVAFLIRAEGLVKSLDTQTPQVLIETRIVEANVDFDQQFGIQWGGHLLFSPLTGNSTGLAFPNPVGVRGGVPDGAAGGAGGGGGAAGGAQGGQGTFGTPNYIVNFPASVGQGRGSALSFLFGSLSGIASLQLRLSAAENTGQVKIISAPKIVTLHKLPASIQQGLQIPFTSASAAGTNTQFISATLSLNVTPQVTTDGSVFLQLNVTNNAPDVAKGSAAGPAITTKTAQTNMLIKDGETMVIGGVYTRNVGWSRNQVPFFSHIPLLGALFQNYTRNDNRAELLIFVTPRIINRAQTLGGRRQ